MGANHKLQVEGFKKIPNYDLIEGEAHTAIVVTPAFGGVI